ncbi:hypothetical protein CABS03_04259 [Colletotrichum abscissum]|uniref:Uncharacterized protein n=2 Tax=Colletotrichum abscissum TaxID=1671311 RepID=A0A9P9XHU2_9PEZI|nr:hypothetical protein CABS02_05708 [Colletotrichum abscissum]
MKVNNDAKEFPPEKPSNSHQGSSNSKADSEHGLNKNTEMLHTDAFIEHFQDSQESSQAPTPTTSEISSLGESFNSQEELSTPSVGDEGRLDDDHERFSPPALVTTLTIFCLYCVFDFWDKVSRKFFTTHWSEILFIVATMVALASVFNPLKTATGLGCVAYTTLHFCIQRHSFSVVGEWNRLPWDLKVIYYLHEADNIGLQTLLMTSLVAWLGPETCQIALKRHIPAWTKELLPHFIAKNL